MLISIDPSDPRPLYVQIIDEVRRAIVLGLVDADEPLPSVRQLAIDLRVNPNTVSQAYRELERSGDVETRRGQGTFVARTGSMRQSRLVEREVAQRALRDAHRSGMSAAKLVEAIHRESARDARRHA